MLCIAGDIAIIVYCRCVTSSRSFARTRSLETRSTSCNIFINMQYNNVDNIYVRNAKSRSESGTIGILRVFSMGNSTTYHITIMHISSFPFGRYFGRNMEDKL